MSRYSLFVEGYFPNFKGVFDVANINSDFTVDEKMILCDALDLKIASVQRSINSNARTPAVAQSFEAFKIQLQDLRTRVTLVGGK